MYFQSNMLAPLPTPLDAAGGADALLRLEVADEVSSAAEKIAALTLRLAISAEVPTALCSGAELEQIASLIELRINNILLGAPRPETVSAPQDDIFKHWLAAAGSASKSSNCTSAINSRPAEQPRWIREEARCGNRHRMRL